MGEQEAVERGSLNSAKETPPTASREVSPSSDAEWARKQARRVGRLIEFTVIAVVLVAVWALFSLPTMYYFREKKVIATSQSDVCTPEVYTGQFCRDALLSRQQCIPGRENTTEIYIQSQLLRQGVSQNTIETVLKSVQSFTEFQSKPECLTDLLPFICASVYPLCNGSGQLFLPSQQECWDVTNSTCMRIVQDISVKLQRLTFSFDIIPKCEDLPISSGLSLQGECTEIQQENQTTSGSDLNTTKLDDSNMTICSSGFYLDANLSVCLPACGVWKPFPNGIVVFNAVLIVTACVCGIASAVAIIIISIWKYQHVFKFPSIIIIYLLINIALLLLVILIGFMDTEGLLCSSQDYATSLTMPTSYCTFYSISFIYLTIQSVIFWVAHIAVLLWLVAFPFQAKQMRTATRLKIVHGAVLTLALVVPAGPVATVQGTGGVKIFYPPNTCVPVNDDAIYYSVILVESILSATGSSLLVFLFWVLVKRRWREVLNIFWMKTKKKSDESRPPLNTEYTATIPITALVKVILSFMCFTSIAVLGLAAGASLLRVQTQYAEELMLYFLCESTGIRPGKVCVRTYESLYTPLLTTFSIFAAGMIYPIFTSVYIINLRDFYHKWIKCGKKKISESVSTDHDNI